MTTQVPPGPENAVAPQEYPQFTMGYAQYPPVQHEHVPYEPAPHIPAQHHKATHAAARPDLVAHPAPQPNTLAHPAPQHNPAAAPPVQHDTTRHEATWQDTGEHQPISAPPAASPAPGYPTGSYPAVTYPQQGATGYPVPVPYPQPGAPTPPPDAYPTAPPWATAQPTTPGPGPAPGSASGPAPGSSAPGGAPGRPVTQHGGLLVPFPDEMQHASRAQAPAVWPVALFTLLFSVLGAVSAKRRADQARRTRNSTAPYWIAFLISALAGAFCWFVVAAVLVGPVFTEVQEGRRLEAVQRNVIGDGQLREARITVTAAQCRAAADRDADGMRDYLCRLTLADGHTASLALTADESGRWQARGASR